MGGNTFLASLPAAVWNRLAPDLELVDVKKGDVIAAPGSPIEWVYFPIRSVVSSVARMADGSIAEVGLVGHEGFSPPALAFETRITPHTSVVCIPDRAFRMQASTFLTAIAQERELRARTRAFAEYTFVAAAQLAACNRVHFIEERYARWLLMTDERVGQRDVPLTQEETAQLLGVRRASITGAAAAMSEAGLITNRRGSVRVRNRIGLENSSCECHHVVRDELQRLMGYSVLKQFDFMPEANRVRSMLIENA